MRRATMAELGLVRDITDAAYTPWIPILGERPLPMDEDYAPWIEAGGVWLAGEPALGLAVVEVSADHLLLFSLAVRPEAQGRGIGRDLLRYVGELALGAGVPEVRLYTNALMARNIRVYAEAGSLEVARRPNVRRPGWVFVDMVKPVLPR